MRREEFFKQLEYLLQDIPDADKEEALAYYRDYLDEAGPENEERVIHEFGSPERVAAIIRADIAGNLEDGGSFTETGYEDERFRDPNYQVTKRLDLPEEREDMRHRDTEYQDERKGGFFHRGSNMDQGAAYTDGTYREYYAESEMKGSGSQAGGRKRWTNSTLKWILWIILIVMASPLILTVGGGVCGVLGIAVGIVVLILGLTAAAFIASVVVAGIGIGFLASAPMDSLFLFGVSLCGIGVGLLGLAVVVLCFGMLFPACVKGIWKCIQALTGRRKEAV